MPIGPKFWHGDVTASLVFPLENNYTQRSDKDQGICTAAALAWCKACLKHGRFINSWSEIGTSVHNLNIVMATLRRLDAAAVAQTELAGVRAIGGDHPCNGIAEVMRAVETSPFGIGIFWNSYHTMGFGYSHHQKDLFDMNYGLFRSKYSAGIKTKIEELYGDDIIGYRLIGKL
jgi:hypothetical protein